MRYDSSTHTDLTDEELIQLVQTGDELAFAQLAARHSFRIWQLVVLNSRQTRDAEEIFQDIWVSVWENIGNLREVRSFGAWLSKIAYTACRRYYTAKSHTGGEILQSTEKLAETIDRDVVAHFREAELRAEVTEAVHHLPEISIFENEICFTDGSATLTTQLVDREYPNYQKIIRESSKDKTVVSKDQILGIAQRMALLANPKKAYPICLEIGTECIRVSTRTPKLTEADETVPVVSGNGSVRIGFDARLLIDALAHVDAESVSIEFLEELNPVLIKPIDDDRHISLVMPLLLERYA